MNPTAPHFINGLWTDGSGNRFQSADPVTGEILWQGREASLKETDHAVYAARQAFEAWVTLPVSGRVAFVERFKTLLDENKQDLAKAISREVGKPLWESLTEVSAMANKIAISIDAYAKRCANVVNTANGEVIATRYRPHGVVAVFGPYNFPGHLANGHIVPALIAGNAVIFKQSEQAPLVGELTVALWEKSGLPRGVLNLVQGGRATGQALAGHPGIDGLFFTGSSQTGIALNKQFADHPEKILALEMGGNNPLIVADVADNKAAAYLTVQSAFQTAGQRCTCARRLIVPKGESGDAFLEVLATMTRSLRVGHYAETPEPFFGPVISSQVAQALLEEQERLLRAGSVTVLPMRLLREGGGLLSPGIIDVTQCSQREDRELFGPLLQVVRVSDFDAAIAEANNTRYGLAAGLICDDRALYEKFYARIRAGIVNWNRQLTGASSAAPFGGVGLSGNHRPSAYFAADYCSYPVASMEYAKAELPAQIAAGISV